MGEVTIYDRAQSSITAGSGGGLSGAILGNVVGYANIKSMLYYSGTRGLPACQYYLYLFNIRMLPGKSFANDAKFFYSATTPKFKADIVTELNQAVLKDSTFTPMVFDSGVPSIKSLTPSGGSVDTTFIYRKTSTTTFNGNGTFTTTLSGGLGTGGTERLFSTDSRDYIISFTSNSYSANLTGTVSTNTSSANATSNYLERRTVTGSGSLFESELKAGDVIRFSNTTLSWVGTVNNVVSNTSLVLVANASAYFNAYKLQNYYPDGSIMNLQDSMLTVTPASNTFTIQLGKTFWVQELLCMHSIRFNVL
jgi:hypothetical protein